jgi:hypothetical protein
MKLVGYASVLAALPMEGGSGGYHQSRSSTLPALGGYVFVRRRSGGGPRGARSVAPRSLPQDGSFRAAGHFVAAASSIFMAFQGQDKHNAHQ